MIGHHGLHIVLTWALVHVGWCRNALTLVHFPLKILFSNTVGISERFVGQRGDVNPARAILSLLGGKTALVWESLRAASLALKDGSSLIKLIRVRDRSVPIHLLILNRHCMHWEALTRHLLLKLVVLGLVLVVQVLLVLLIWEVNHWWVHYLPKVMHILALEDLIVLIPWNFGVLLLIFHCENFLIYNFKL